MSINIIENIKKQYAAEGGYKEFFLIAIPLILSTGINSVQLFINRTFLSWYSKEAFAASVPASIANFAILSLFLGTLAYVDVFVAQYYGKKEYRSIGPAVWQSVYLALGAAFIIFCLSFFAESFFMGIGHPTEVAREEGVFFKVLCYGAFFTLAGAALAGFYAGRGKTKVVLFVSLFGVIMNVILDILLIFGNLGFPRMGIVGSAIASMISSCLMLIVSVILVTSKKNNEIFNTRKLTPNFDFIKRLFKYGFPNGCQFFFDMAGFSIFILLIGTLGVNELAASNIALNINHLAMMPVVGCGMTTSILVGKYLGQNRPSISQSSVRSSSEIIYVYLIIVTAALLLFPKQLIYPFVSGGHMQQIGQTEQMAIHVLRILAAYMVFDGTNVIFAAAIKGAGDTAFVMRVLVILSIVMVIIPTYLIVIVFQLGLYAAWWFMLLYVAALAGIFFARYKSNKWKKMRVIEMDISEN
ncbi:MAG: MATE family efflux transporter [Elusimicrobiota bacterium]|jgi:MATE family multidrug resistance protein|nr:MATE family efflux transporter [Elusimicrobiota bacterium]